MTVVLKRLKDNIQWQRSSLARSLSFQSTRMQVPDVSKGQNRYTLHSLDLSFSHKNLHGLTYTPQQNKWKSQLRSYLEQTR